jgi:hypothetical protein
MVTEGLLEITPKTDIWSHITCPDSAKKSSAVPSSLLTVHLYLLLVIINHPHGEIILYFSPHIPCWPWKLLKINEWLNEWNAYMWIQKYFKCLITVTFKIWEVDTNILFHHKPFLHTIHFHWPAFQIKTNTNVLFVSSYIHQPPLHITTPHTQNAPRNFRDTN